MSEAEAEAVAEAEETLLVEFHGCRCESCADPDDWYEALAVLMAERAPA